MNQGLGTYLNLLWTFGLMSLLAVGGANATIPEMHRVAVDVNHWLTDAQFADMFAIAQFSPGPNVLIVTLIGYQVAGLAGAAVTTFAMCGPAGVLAYFVANFFHRSSHSFWPSIIQASFVPVSIGLMAAGGYVVHTFPTGQGNVVGNPIVPVIKISANPRTVRTMGEHIDVDVSGILRRDMTIDQAGDVLIDMIEKTANGRLTAAEALGHREFVMTKLYRSA